MLRYLYCALPARSAPDLSDWGGEGAPLELVQAGGVAGVLGRVEPARYGAKALSKATRDAEAIGPYALAHQAVVQFAFERAPECVVPLAFGSVHRTRAEAILALEAEAPRLRRLFARLKGTQEWGLRVVWRAPDPAALPSSDVPGAGTAYLRGRLDALRTRGPDAAAVKAAEKLALRMRRASVREEVTNEREGDLLLRAAYLVPTEKARAMRAAVLSAADDLASLGLTAELSGPWPPYTFAAKR